MGVLGWANPSLNPIKRSWVSKLITQSNQKILGWIGLYIFFIRPNPPLIMLDWVDGWIMKIFIFDKICDFKINF